MPWSEWMRAVEVEPSLYAADFSQLGAQIETLINAGVRIFHYDVGDGHFVEPITIGPIVLASISKAARDAGARFDCHLMTERPERHFAAIAEAGGESVTVHYEACPDLAAVAGAAREQGLQVGVAFKPQTDPEQAARAATDVGADLVLCMSIEPGYSGQQFMPEALERIAAARAALPESVPVQVDGGIDAQTIGPARAAGATLFVAGSAIFGGGDLPRAYGRLLQALQ